MRGRVDYGQFATKADLINLRTELKGDMSELRVEMAEQFTSVAVLGGLMTYLT